MASETPEQVGPYQLRGELGRGGMGVVYRAWDPRLDREVAIKMLPAGLLQDPQSRERFVAEARSAGRLQHANILPVFDVGELNGQPYIVMQYVQGEELAAVLRARGRLGVADAAPMLRQIASAVDFAHAHGVVHRDLKPENVMLDGRGQARLMDFGIARSTDTTGRGLTRTGMVMGTPEYMSPEQAAGTPVDYRSDLYSLGVIAYRMLTGSVPFSGDSVIGVALQHVQQPPPDPRSLASDLSPGAAAALLRMLAKDPNERFASATDFVDALEAARCVAVPSAPPPSGAPAATAGLPRSTRLPKMMAAIVLAVVGGALVTAAVLSHSEKPDGPPPPPLPPPVTPPKPMVTVPDLRRCRREDAEAALRSRQLVPEVGEEWSAQPSGEVVRQDRVGQTVPEGTHVAMVVSKGRPPEVRPPVGAHEPVSREPGVFRPGDLVVYRDRERQNLNLRAAPSIDAPRVTKIAYGSLLHVLGRQGDWVCVEYAGDTGWCMWHSPKDLSYVYLHLAGETDEQ